MSRLRPRITWAGPALLALLAFVPLLSSHAGRLPADTKLGLSLNPGRLIADSVRSWDPRQFGGWVPHQSVSYLWPSGPFYWLGEHIGLPSWVVERLWVASVLFAAGAGMWWFVRRRGYGGAAALAAAMVYQLSPYVLPYVSRTSLMLLPWAAAGWLAGLAEQATRRKWARPAAAFGLVVLTVGSVNMTATLLIAPLPLLHLATMAANGEVPWRRALSTIARLAAVSLAVSLWWLTMLVMQGRYGADALSYSETLEAVSSTSTAPEVLRAMGYWLSYVFTPSGATTAAAEQYLWSPRLIVGGFALLGICLAGLVTVRTRERRLAGALLVVGTVLAVGPHPLAEAAPLMQGVARSTRSTLALALRSSTRAVPLVVFAAGLGAAALVQATAARRRTLRLGRPLAALVGCLALVNLPPLYHRTMVDAGLLHDPRPPSTWTKPLAQVNAGDPERRVLQMPGIESQAFDWGYTVDPPLAMLLDRPLVTRDWLPLGSPEVMDLLYAFDDRAQAGTLEPSTVAPIGRFLAADTIWLAGDLDTAKFSSATPASVATVLGQAADVAGSPPAGRAPALYSIDAVPAITRASRDTVIVYGSGDGVVDAAAAGLLTGDEAVLYAADLSDIEIGRLVAAGARVVVTDSNRDQARQWRGSQDTRGFTESGDATSDLLTVDPQDVRLPLFSRHDSDGQTVAELGGGLRVRATGYGSHLRYLPEYRPSNAVDGDPGTAWVVGVDGGPVVGQRLELSSTDGQLRLVQPSWADGDLHHGAITSVAVTDSTGTRTVALDGATDVDVAPGSVSIEIRTTDTPHAAVGFAEVLPTAHPETIRLPVDASPADIDVTVMTRWRNSRSGHDPETVLRRRFQSPEPTLANVVATVHGDLATGCRQLLTIDAASWSFDVTATDAAALAAGGSATVRPCDAGVARSAGDTHTLVADRRVDRVVVGDLRHPVATAGPTDEPTVTIVRGRTAHRITVSGCAGGCWLVFGEGYSTGWSAASGDGSSIGRHMPIAGGFNGWWVQPPAGGDTVHVTVSWAGQTPFDASLVLSGIAAVACVGVLLRRRVRDAAHPERAVAEVGRCPSTRRRVAVVGAVAAAVVSITVSPVWAAIIVVLAALAAALRRPALLTVAGLSTIVVLGVLVGWEQRGHRYRPDFGWPGHFEQFHRPMLAAAVVLGIGLLGSVAPGGYGRPGDGADDT